MANESKPLGSWLGRRLSRRGALAALATTATAGLLAACQPSAAPAPKPTAPPAPAATTAPKPAATQAPAPTTAPAATQAPAAKKLPPITVAAGGATDHVTVLAGVDKGVYAKYGLDVKVKAFATGPEAINALQANDIQFAVLGSAPLLTSVYNGIPVILVSLNHGDATADLYAENQGVIASKQSGAKAGQIESLKGKKVGLPLGTDAEPYFKGLLQSKGLKDSDVTIQNMTPADVITALKQNQIDAFCVWEPVQANALKQVEGAVEVWRGNSPTWYGPGTTLSTTAFMQKDPETAKAFLTAHAEMHLWVRKNFDEAGVIASRWITGLDPEIAKVAVRHAIYDCRLSKKVYNGLQNTTMPFLESQGKLKKYDVSKAIDHKIIVQIEKEHPEFFTDLPPIPAEAKL